MNAHERFGSGTAVVTGGGSGIGEGLVRHLAALGMTVVTADIDADSARAVADDLSAQGLSAVPYQVDVTDAEAVEAMAAQLFRAYGTIDLLVNNAGVENAGLIWEVDPERWERLMAINVGGVFHGLRSFVPRMIEAGSPSVIVNMSSVGGVSSAALQAPYIVSKHAVLALTECLHQEVALVGAPIQVSVVLPHAVRSRIFSSARRDAPTGNAMANQMFDVLQQANDTIALDPRDAAEHMIEAVARGDFWVFSHDDLGKAAVDRRAAQLSALTPPPNPRQVLKDSVSFD
ncbi:SDR family NAD(P)-dependent oxidoreductase [Microtetraspora malaysiensis]|uniref:SDR family NAD(P)-dependent oxidoreductase n=1 Tax=Microtetraspora malaysiensis TaxID=161358 RepID=UPI003D8D9908